MLKNIKDMGWTIPSGLVYTEEGNSVKITIPNDATIGTKYTIKYSNNSCSKSVTVTVGGDTPTPPEPTTDCYCDASGTYNGISAMYRKEGSGGLAVPVGYIDLARGCTSLTPKCTSIICRENTCSDGSEVIASTSDVTFQENYEGHDWGVFAIIKENTQGSMRRVRIYFNCLNTSESADPGELNYINFFQAG
jgi:hypothetical protein